MAALFEKKRRQADAFTPSCPRGLSKCFLLLHLLFWLSQPCSQALPSPNLSAPDMVTNSVRRQGVDSSLRKYSFLAMSQQSPLVTSHAFNVTLTPFLSGIYAQALCLPSSNSLQQQDGLTLNEFSITPGAQFLFAMAPTSTDSPLLLIYRKIFNFTMYSLPPTYSFASPVVGIIVFSPRNFTTDDPSLPEVTISFAAPSITITLPISLASAPSTSVSCAFFAPNGSISFASVASIPNVCTSDTLGDVALVLPTQDVPIDEKRQQQQPQQQQPQQQQLQPQPAVHSSTASISATKAKKHWKLALAASCLGMVGAGFCVALAVASVGLFRRLKVVIMARLSGNDEALQTSLIGISRAPSAPGVRTKPALEMDMARF